MQEVSDVAAEKGGGGHQKNEGFVQNEEPLDDFFLLGEGWIGDDDVAVVMFKEVGIFVYNREAELLQVFTALAVAVEWFPERFIFWNVVFNRFPGALGSHIVIVQLKGLGTEAGHFYKCEEI